jgi:hypothetical protein
MGTLPVERVQFEAALAALLASYGSGGTGGTGTILATRLTLINAVKVKLDEIIPEGEGVVFTLASPPNISDPLDIFINALLDESAKHLLLMAPLHALTAKIGSVTAYQITAFDNGRKSGWVKLPDDFLRLVSFQMQDWERPVIIPVSSTSKLYLKQHNQWLCGANSKPVAAFTSRNDSGTSKLVLEYFTVTASHTVDHFLYIPETLAENVQSNLTDALEWICAGKILQITERVDLAMKAMEHVQICFNNM